MGDADFEGPWLDDWDPWWSPPYRRRPTPRPSDIDEAIAAAPERPRPVVLSASLTSALVEVAEQVADLDMNDGDYGYGGEWFPSPSVENWPEVVEAIAARMRAEGWRPPKKHRRRRDVEPVEDGSALRFMG